MVLMCFIMIIVSEVLMLVNLSGVGWLLKLEIGGTAGKNMRRGGVDRRQRLIRLGPGETCMPSRGWPRGVCFLGQGPGRIEPCTSSRSFFPILCLVHGPIDRPMLMMCTCRLQYSFSISKQLLPACWVLRICVLLYSRLLASAIFISLVCHSLRLLPVPLCPRVEVSCT